MRAHTACDLPHRKSLQQLIEKYLPLPQSSVRNRSDLFHLHDAPPRSGTADIDMNNYLNGGRNLFRQDGSRDTSLHPPQEQL